MCVQERRASWGSYGAGIAALFAGNRPPGLAKPSADRNSPTRGQPFGRLRPPGAKIHAMAGGAHCSPVRGLRGGGLARPSALRSSALHLPKGQRHAKQRPSPGKQSLVAGLAETGPTGWAQPHQPSAGTFPLISFAFIRVMRGQLRCVADGRDLRATVGAGCEATGMKKPDPGSAPGSGCDRNLAQQLAERCVRRNATRPVRPQPSISKVAPWSGTPCTPAPAISPSCST